jgi:hypothetical protein
MFQALTGTDAGNRRIRRPVHLNDIIAIIGTSSDRLWRRDMDEELARQSEC